METQSATVKGISATTGKVEGDLETHSKNTSVRLREAKKFLEATLKR